MTKQIEILGCFVGKISSGLPQRGIWFGTNTRCIKKLPSFRLVLHKVAVVNEWRGRISATIDKSCTQYGPHHVEHRFFNYPLAQHVWHYVAKNHLATFFVAKSGNLDPRNFSFMMQCPFNKPFNKPLKPFSKIWFCLEEWPFVDHLVPMK